MDDSASLARQREAAADDAVARRRLVFPANDDERSRSAARGRRLRAVSLPVAARLELRRLTVDIVEEEARRPADEARPDVPGAGVVPGDDERARAARDRSDGGRLLFAFLKHVVDRLLLIARDLAALRVVPLQEDVA